MLLKLNLGTIILTNKMRIFKMSGLGTKNQEIEKLRIL